MLPSGQEITQLKEMDSSTSDLSEMVPCILRLNRSHRELEAAFRSAVQPEQIIEMEWDGQVLESQKKEVITTAPPLLVLELTRYTITGDKLDTKLKFGHTLDLTPYLSTIAKRQGAQAKYRLSGIVVHSGQSTRSGHYFAYIRDRMSGVWWQVQSCLFVLHF